MLPIDELLIVTLFPLNFTHSIPSRDESYRSYSTDRYRSSASAAKLPTEFYLPSIGSLNSTRACTYQTDSESCASRPARVHVFRKRFNTSVI